jgi:hypothetical protein
MSVAAIHTTIAAVLDLIVVAMVGTMFVAIFDLIIVVVIGTMFVAVFDLVIGLMAVMRLLRRRRRIVGVFHWRRLGMPSRFRSRFVVSTIVAGRLGMSVADALSKVVGLSDQTSELGKRIATVPIGLRPSIVTIVRSKARVVGVRHSVIRFAWLWQISVTPTVALSALPHLIWRPDAKNREPRG